MTTKQAAQQGKVIARIITNCGTQVALAEKIGVSQALISKWATGKARVTPTQAIALERQFPDVVSRAELRPDLWG